MASSSKKITYTSDFKLKVLDYYFKNGGDENFGLKKKTAGHFNIDKKTINRMLNNPDMVKRARKLLTKKVTGSTKGAAAARHGGTKATAKGAKGGSKLGTSGAKLGSSGAKLGSSGAKLGSSGTKLGSSGTKLGSSGAKLSSGAKPAMSGAKLGSAGTSGRVAGSSYPCASNTSSSTLKTPTSSTVSTKHGGGSSSNQGSNSATNAATKSNTSKIKYMGQEGSGVQVFDLPEDPDYSLLKRSINASANGVANIARLLVTATEEVRKIILNECDMIIECKVCHNLFRSVVNFLAHKRIYCQEEFADVRTLFHKDDVQGITSHSNTVFVEPEPPPDVHPSTSSAPDLLSKPARSAMQGMSRHTGIDSIAAKLSNRRKQRAASHDTGTGSSKYYERLGLVNMTRDKLSRDCSVVLEDIGGVANARYQTFLPPSSSTSVSMNTILSEVSERSSGLTVAINEHGEIVKTAPGNVRTIDVEEPKSRSGISKDLVCNTCNTKFATQKTLSVHQRSYHGFERYIYCCPICKTSFLSMWAVIKHLQRFHKKTKHQTERLRKVIKKNVDKKMVYQSEDHHGEYCHMNPLIKTQTFHDDEEIEKEELEMENQPSKMEIASPAKSSIIPSPRKCSSTKSPLKRDDLRSGCSPEHRCVKCDRKFMTASALISHDKFCSLLQMRPDILPENPLNPRLRSETPEKKIAIQIRKDYKKTMIPHSPNKANHEESPQNQKTFKVPEIPKEQEKENQRKIEMMMSEFCNMTRLTCIPCEKRYQTITTLKRHASQHFSWTRFACKQCKFRSYHKYETVRHCISDHKANEHNAGTMIIDDESFGPLRYFLVSEDDTSVSSDIDELDSHASRSRSTSASSDKISTGHFNDVKNSKEKSEGNSEDIRQTVVIKESVNMSDAKDISNDIQAMSTKEENEVSKGNITTEESSDNVKLSDVQDKEKDPDYKDKIKIESTNLTKFDTSVDNAKFSLQNTDGKLLETNTTEPFSSQSLNMANLEQSSVIKMPDTIVTNDLSENKNCEIEETVDECKHTKESTNIREYFLRGLTESTSNRNHVYEDTEEARIERPQRLRRSVEQKDFIYNIRISGLQKSEIEAGKRCSPLKKDLECKSNGKHGTRRKNSFSKSEMLSKKVKVNDESATREACNGDTKLNVQNKCEHVQNKCASVHSDTSDKGSSSHLISTNRDIDSSQQLEIEEEHVQLGLLDNSDSNYCHLSKKMSAENPFVNSKPDSSNNNSKSVLLINSATTKTILIECHEEGNPTLNSNTVEKNVLEAESETNIQVIDNKLLETDIVEGSPIATHIFENGKNQEYGNEEKSNKVTQLDNCEDKFWEDGKVKNVDKDINLEEQKPVMQTTRKSLNVPANND